MPIEVGFKLVHPERSTSLMDIASENKLAAEVHFGKSIVFRASGRFFSRWQLANIDATVVTLVVSICGMMISSTLRQLANMLSIFVTGVVNRIPLMSILFSEWHPLKSDDRVFTLGSAISSDRVMDGTL